MEGDSNARIIHVHDESSKDVMGFTVQTFNIPSRYAIVKPEVMMTQSVPSIIQYFSVAASSTH